MRSFVLLLIITLSTNWVDGQTNWRPGYIIENGKTLEGQIDDREWPYFIGEVRFRTSPTDAVRTFLPDHGIDFGTGGRRYVSRSVRLITNSRELDQITRDTARNRQTTQGFLRQHIQGALSLYQFIDDSGKRHFYVSVDEGGLEYLEFEKHLRPESTKDVLKTVDRYKYQLVRMAADCPELSSSVSGLRYTRKDLTRFLQKLYTCRGETPTFLQKTNRGSINVAPVVQYYRSQLVSSFNDDRGENLSEISFDPAFGMALRYSFPELRGKFSVRLESVFHRFDDISNSRLRQDGNQTVELRRELSLSTMLTSVLAQYEVSSGRIPVYVELGITTGFVLDSEFNFLEVRTQQDGSRLVLDSTAPERLQRGNDVGFAAGFGVLIDRLQIGMRASRSSRDRTSDTRVVYRTGATVHYWF